MKVLKIISAILPLMGFDGVYGEGKEILKDNVVPAGHDFEGFRLLK
jgi:hypothetical protein